MAYLYCPSCTMAAAMPPCSRCHAHVNPPAPQLGYYYPTAYTHGLFTKSNGDSPGGRSSRSSISSHSSHVSDSSNLGDPFTEAGGPLPKPSKSGLSGGEHRFLSSLDDSDLFRSRMYLHEDHMSHAALVKFRRSQLDLLEMRRGHYPSESKRNLVLAIAAYGKAVNAIEELNNAMHNVQKGDPFRYLHLEQFMRKKINFSLQFIDFLRANHSSFNLRPSSQASLAPGLKAIKAANQWAGSVPPSPGTDQPTVFRTQVS